GLDPVNSNIIKDEIFNLAKKGATIIFSTHRMEQVEEICDHIILVNRGQKILDGTVREVKQQFKQNLFRIGLSGTAPAAESPAFETVRTEPDGVLVVRIRDGFGPNDVLLHFLQQNITVTAFNELLPSLNDIFIRLVESKTATRQFQTVTA
ncbi:MAG TPA: DUF4162 domain-containing protein, partial [Chitinophagaceae bacterium]|nr:DUF4162 domain-containing protein [Chitinophagaceae bacterium]